MAAKNKLSIYLIKSEFIDYEDIIDKYSSSQTVENVGVVYLGESHSNPPKWAASFLTDRVDTEGLFVSNARAVLLVTTQVTAEEQRIFAIVMGYGRNMLKDDVVEERFGLKVVLNTIKEDSLRRINKRDIGGNQKLSNEQLPLKSGINDFGIDINRDMVGFVAGVSDDESYATGIIAGGDILSLSVEVDISSIVEFLQKTFGKYVARTYRDNFAWIDQIQEVKDSRITERLNSLLIQEINNGTSNIWMAVPEVIDWSGIRGFKYHGAEVFDDIIVAKVKESFRNGLTSFDQLKSKRIIAVSALDDSEKYHWTAAKCLFGELSLEGKAYCINSGRWYCIDADFVEQIEHEYSVTPISTIQFDNYTDAHNGENSYSEDFVKSHSEQYLLLDRQNISYGGGRSKVELCDILSREKELIHIKPYSGSSTLSHLFNQAAVSTELLLSDAIFLQQANSRIGELSEDRAFQIDDSRSIKIVVAIITKDSADLPQIPFFSKVTFRYLRNRLKAFGLDVSMGVIKNAKATV